MISAWVAVTLFITVPLTKHFETRGGINEKTISIRVSGLVICKVISWKDSWTDIFQDPSYNKNMKIFSEKHQELKDFEEVILDIEKEQPTSILKTLRSLSIKNKIW